MLIDLLWPGAGHLVVGRRVVGVTWMAATWAAVAAALLWPPALAFAVVARVGSALDAGLGRIRPGRATSKVVAVVVALVMIGVLGVPVRLWVLELFKIPSGGMAPTLVPGDHVLVNKLRYRLGRPTRGDVAVFRSPCAPHDTYVKRVVGLPGDSIEIRCDVLYVNDKAVPAELLSGDQTWWDKNGPRLSPEHSSLYRETLDWVSYSIYSPVNRPALDRERRAHPEAAPQALAGRRDFPGVVPPSCATETGRTPGAGPGDAPTGRIEGARAPVQPCTRFRHYVVPSGTVFVLGDNRYDSNDSTAFGTVPLDHLVGKVSGIWFSARSMSQGGIQWSRLGRVH